ncbi:MAG: glycosyltransferase family 4 protein [Chloroflexi bacterium]|nr:glycosyltransferase family 4 protein [Chloroflexota bacterium]
MKPSASNHRFPKTIVMARSIPPAVTGSSIIVGNLAKQFSRDEMIVIGAWDPGTPRVAWSKAWPRLRYPVLWSIRWRGERWIRRAQLPWLVLFTTWIVLTRRVKAIIAVYPGDIYLLAAYLVARLTGRDLYGYFHNTYLENNQTALARWLQPRVFAYAKHTFVMSEGMERLYNQNYPELVCSPLKHTFNDELPPVEDPPLHDPVRLCFSGTLNQSCADAASRMAQMVQEVDGVALQIFTGTPLPAVEKLGFTGSKVTVGTVSRDELIDRLRDSDILLLPHGFTSTFAQEEILTIFPTKVIEYLISGRPILAHMPPDCFLAEFLRRHDCALIVDEPDVTSLKHSLDRLCNDAALRSRLVHNARAAAKQFEAPTVAAYLRDVITHHSG